MKIDGANLLDGIISGGQESFEPAAVSTGDFSSKVKQVEGYTKGEQMSEVVYHKPDQQEQAGTVDDVMQQAENMDAARMKDEMVVAAHTTTTTDCRQMEEDGFSLHQTDIHTVVTETDKIKMQLAKAGVDISYFGDKLSSEQIRQLTDSGVGAALVDKMQRADVPLTEENLEDCGKASRQAEEVRPLGDGALKYMLDNELEPTIANLYLAQYSGSAMYRNENVPHIDLSDMQEQMERIAAQAGRENDEDVIQDSQWLIENQIPLTPQNLAYLDQLKSMTLPPDADTVQDAMVTAMAEGGRPQDAMLLEGYSLADRAQHAVDVVAQATAEDVAYVAIQNQPVTLENIEQAHNQIQAGALTPEEQQQVAELVESTENAQLTESPVKSEESADDTAGPVENTESADSATPQVSAPGASENGSETGSQSQNGSQYQNSMVNVAYTEIQITVIVARRQLEEVRLAMTVEASYMMLKQGISVDTQPMESLIGELRAIENAYYKNLLTQGGVEATEANVSLFAETTEKLEQLKGMPVYILGIPETDVSTLNRLHSAGSEMQQDFQQANKRYETMQTQVREDLGDSIEKAFQNIDDMLEDMDLDITAANERAVRILAYNRTEITVQNIAQMKLADQQVQMAFKNLSPAVVRELIGRGINPLDMNITDLNRLAEEIKDELNIDSMEEKYSEYLYKLEQNRSITQEERSSYIGIYRLMNQVVQSDGAAVGAVVNRGAQLTMRNLLLAVRAEHHGGVDVSVDDSYGELEQSGYRDSITAQIDAALRANRAEHHGGVDVSVDDSYGELEQSGYRDPITAQIDAGYQNQCVKQALDEISPERFRSVLNETDWEDLTPEQFLQKLREAPEDLNAEESYYKQQLEDFTQCTKAANEVYQALERYDIPNTVQNVMAMRQLMQDRNGAYRRLFGMGNGREADVSKSIDKYMKKTEDGEVEVDFNAVREELLRRFSEDVKRPEGLAKAMAELADCAENCMSTFIIERDVSSMDIRELKLMNTQISLSSQMARQECFSIPMVVDGEMTNVTLKVIRGKERKGMINITLETERLGRIAAEFEAKKDRISGYLATSNRQTKIYLQSMKDTIAQSMQQDEAEEMQVDLSFVNSSSLNLNHFGSGTSVEPESGEDREVQTRTLYGMAEGFIRILRQLDK